MMRRQKILIYTEDRKIKVRKNNLSLVPWDLGTSVFIFSKTCSSNRSECKRCCESDSCCFRSLTSLCNLETPKRTTVHLQDCNRRMEKERIFNKAIWTKP